MSDSDEAPASAKLDTSVPHSARVWNYWLGGKDNFQVDRAVGDQFEQLYPDITVVARSSRGFLKRAVTFLATDAGIRQFLDVGTGMPTAENTHQVAQAAVPEARIVYVDNDPLVLVHARALLTGTPRVSPSTSTPTCATRTRFSRQRAVRRSTCPSPPG